MTEDYLEQDDSIPGQKYVCLSFISPEKVLKDKNIYFLHSFLKHSFKDVKLTENELSDKFKDYLFNKQDELEENFYKKNNFQTSVRGVKIRGVYDTDVEAKHRASRLQKKDPNFNVYIGQVGFWLPWEPETHKVQDEQFAEQQLNELMSEYKKNQEYKDEVFEEDKRQKIENMKKEREDAEKKRKQEELENPKQIEEVPDDLPELEEVPDDNTEEQTEEQTEEEVESNVHKEEIKQALEDDDPWMKRKQEDEKKKDE